MAVVSIPRVLASATVNREISIAATTLDAAIAELLAKEPALRVHLFDESGDLRPHVLCFVDGVATRLDNRQAAIINSTQIRFIQAVSGG